MDTTQLDLLTRDGKVSVTFYPALDTDHYAHLIDLSTECGNKDEFRRAIGIAAQAWFRDVQID